MPASLANPYALRLLRSMIYGDLTILTPRIDQDIYYPKVVEVSRVAREETAKLLVDLWEQGYLQRTLYGKAYRCPFDGSTSLRPRLLCPTCQTEDIEKVQLIEHTVCGHVDMEKSFQKGDEYVCPKDGKKLRQIGVDYRKLGVAYHCLSCGGNYPTPLERWSCLSSDHTFSLEDAGSEKLFSYTLNDEKRSSILRIFEFIQPIADIFKASGFKVETFYSIKGASGVSHLVDVYAIKNPDKPVINIAGVLVEDAIKPEEVLKLVAISMDINAAKAFLIVVPKLDDTSSAFARNLALNIIEGKDLETASQQLSLELKKGA